MHAKGAVSELEQKAEDLREELGAIDENFHTRNKLSLEHTTPKFLPCYATKGEIKHLTLCFVKVTGKVCFPSIKDSTGSLE